MATRKHNRTLFILLHQIAVLLSGIAAFKISQRGDLFLVPLLVGLVPLLHALNFWCNEPESADARKLRTYLLSSLVGFVVALALMAYWMMWAAAIAYGGFGF